MIGTTIETKMGNDYDRDNDQDEDGFQMLPGDASEGTPEAHVSTTAYRCDFGLIVHKKDKSD
ncbi:MAG: hypothetical protein QGH15_05075 [Kiritimatiellia bacterium]|jgi:hypothetical protein|nr:hypothetical protein [Kiritimatiellia bacterium]